ncbi:MAG: class I SAM-dependent methyltransferase [Patescibacteria group bacterium]|nr:class I SAM-dependent methyltransferase [Patescibacteria group bacterium]
MKLDIACGQNKRPGFKGVDIVPGPGIDFVWNLEEYPWQPFEDDSVEEVYCSHYLEHVSDLMQFMDEVWRICEDGAKVTFLCPYYTSIRAWQDPTHKRAISEATFLYFDRDWRKANKLDHYPIKSNFKIQQIMVFFNPPWDKKTEEARQFAAQHYWNVVSDILVELKVIKD